MGKSRDLTQFTRGQVNVLKSEGYSQRQIASRLHISKCAVQNAIRLGENSNRKNCGRPKKTTLREDRLLKAALYAVLMHHQLESLMMQGNVVVTLVQEQLDVVCHPSLTL